MVPSQAVPQADCVEVVVCSVDDDGRVLRVSYGWQPWSEAASTLDRVAHGLRRKANRVTP